MNFFKKLFRQKNPGGNSPQPPNPPAQSSNPDPSKNPNLIRVFDGYGRELFISKEEWRKNLLPGGIKTHWNDPDNLYGIIFSALNDGFRADVIDAGERLYKIDQDRVRATCVWGIILKEEGRLDEAEKVLQDFLKKHGENGSILTNLAKIYSKRQQKEKSEQLLWHALEVDPNQDNGFGWYVAIWKERGGEVAGLEATQRVAKLPGSWRGQLLLARRALQERRLEQAMAFYNQCFQNAGKPVPADMLMQMSGDLGNAGHLPEILQLVEPWFDAQMHGVKVGNNLIKAHLDLGQIDAAQHVVSKLYALNRMDWVQTLNFWDKEIARHRIVVESTDEKGPVQTALAIIEGPVWLKPDSPTAKVFPVKPAGSMNIAFLGSSARVATNSKKPERQLSNAQGRLSRALPLFLAEQVHFGSLAAVQTLVPWLTGKGGGAFVLFGTPVSDEDAAAYARQNEKKCDYIVTVHLEAQAEPWEVRLRLIRTIDAKCLATHAVSFPSEKPEGELMGLPGVLLTLLKDHAEVDVITAPDRYRVPPVQNLNAYLLRLEQLLAIRASGMEGAQAQFLSGEHEILDGGIQLCVECPNNVSVRILLAQTLCYMKKVRPDVVALFKDKVALLQKEKPLVGTDMEPVKQLFDEIFAAGGS